ncbi:pentatricopeptide repeat-containing protein At4g21300-like [Mercurialis annua]|uniref:pentatricopeptide repeat-containing protein At4g21300-like n=1 Tax=Mercurialis annua TaxID=3986 RepID=UPI00215F0061|nr:pentatricopeptide repeat-containing protein At4g21300-like [Mercurialis annua]
MFNKFTKSLNALTQFLDNSCQTKNLKHIKNLYGHLITTGSLCVAPYIHTKLIFLYTTSHTQETQLKTLTNCCKILNPNDPLPFNLLLSDFCKNGCPLYAVKILNFMHKNSVSLDTYALCSSLVASCCMKNVRFGEQIHTHVIKLGWLCSVFVGSALVDLYAKLSFLRDAARVFDEIPVRNTVCANALLSGFIEAKLWNQGVELIKEMPVLNLVYDRFTFSAMLRISAGLPAVEFGKEVHGLVIRRVYGDLESDVFMQSSLIEMYGKCGHVNQALRVFNMAGFRIGRNINRDIVLWTSMLGVFGRNGQFEEVIALFKEMLKEGMKPDGVAYVTVISACGHTGQVELGIEYFESMSRDFNINPSPEHYSCVVDLFCRAGQLDKAWKVVDELLTKGHGNYSISMWGALLSACEKNGILELGEVAAQEALKLEPQNVGIYMMLSNLYAKLGKWDEIKHLREIMKERQLKKDVGCSWIEITS